MLTIGGGGVGPVGWSLGTYLGLVRSWGQGSWPVSGFWIKKGSCQTGKTRCNPKRMESCSGIPVKSTCHLVAESWKLGLAYPTEELNESDGCVCVCVRVCGWGLCFQQPMVLFALKHCFRAFGTHQSSI